MCYLNLRVIGRLAVALLDRAVSDKQDDATGHDDRKCDGYEMVEKSAKNPDFLIMLAL